MADSSGGFMLHRKASTMKPIHFLLIVFASSLLLTSSTLANYEEGNEAYRNHKYARAYKLYLKAARSGDMRAQLALGEMLSLSHYGVEANPSESRRWYQAACEQGSAHAQHVLADLYSGGDGVEVDIELAKELYHKAIAGGDLDSYYCLGRLYLNGPGQDEAMALKTFLKATELGHADSQNMMGHLNANGILVPKDLQKAASWYRKAAAQEDERAMDNLARMIALGHTQARPEDDLAKLYHAAANRSQAHGESKDQWLAWEKLGAEAGSAASMLSLYSELRDQEKYEEAKEWLFKAAESGDRSAQYTLAQAYEYGYDLTPDPEQAIKWYLKAEQRGDGQAPGALAYLYYDRKDFAKARTWYRKSADMGDHSAEFILGRMHEEGLGGPADSKLAFQWYSKAAKGGETDASDSLGRMYYEGIGTKKDLRKAMLHLQESNSYEARDIFREIRSQYFSDMPVVANASLALELPNGWTEDIHQTTPPGAVTLTNGPIEVVISGTDQSPEDILESQKGPDIVESSATSASGYPVDIRTSSDGLLRLLLVRGPQPVVVIAVSDTEGVEWDPADEELVFSVINGFRFFDWDALPLVD
jgi:TPR repeat protein